MLSHAQIWSAIDALAGHCGLSPSGLAKKAGLDPTTFNRSKRITPDGRARWPSTESIAKVLDATGTPLDRFMALVAGVSETGARLRTIPLIGIAQAGSGVHFDREGLPIGDGWEEVAFPGNAGAPVYALEVSGDSMEPVYRDGDIIIVAPGSPVRRDDRVVVRTVAGEVMAKVLRRQTTKSIELRSLNPAHPDRIVAADEVAWMARILWASQ